NLRNQSRGLLYQLYLLIFVHYGSCNRKKTLESGVRRMNTNKNEMKTKIKDFFQSKKFKYGSNAIIMIAAVVVLVLLVNRAADKLGLSDIKLDLTKHILYSIGDETKQILSELDKDVVIYGLFDDEKIGSGEEYKDVIELLGKYDDDPRVEVKYVDPD